MSDESFQNEQAERAESNIKCIDTLKSWSNDLTESMTRDSEEKQICEVFKYIVRCIEIAQTKSIDLVPESQLILEDNTRFNDRGFSGIWVMFRDENNNRKPIIDSKNLLILSQSGEISMLDEGSVEMTIISLDDVYDLANHFYDVIVSSKKS